MSTKNLESPDIDSLTIEETFSRLWNESKLVLQAVASGRSADLKAALDAREVLLRHASQLALGAKPDEIPEVLDYAERIRKLIPEVESRLRSQEEEVNRELVAVRKGEALARRYVRPKIGRGGAIFGRDA